MRLETTIIKSEISDAHGADTGIETGTLLDEKGNAVAVFRRNGDGSITFLVDGQEIDAYDLASQVTGAPDANAVVLRFVVSRPFTLSASGHQAVAGTAATAETDFLVKVNGTTKATLRFAADGDAATIIGGTAADVVAGDVVTVIAPASPDDTLADIGFTLKGTL